MNSAAPQSQIEAAAKVREKLSDRWWRLNNLYYIKDDDGKKVLFKPNQAQRTLYSGMWFLNIILKARQLGMTTFIQIFILDACLFNSNTNAGVVAHNKEDATKFFREKIKFAYDNLPAWLRQERPATTDRAGEMVFSNGSLIYVSSSLRSGTYQYLHISEFGKVCAKYPEKAREIVTGALNTVHAGNFIFIESTAEGQTGYFYDYCQQSQRLQQMGSDLTAMDYKFWFFPWYEHPTYRLFENVAIPDRLAKYFDDIEKMIGKHLPAERRAWYVKKEATMKDDMKREFPSTPKEAFEQAIEGTYLHREMAIIRMQNRIRDVPFDHRLPVYAFFDLGRNDSTAIWFMQNLYDEYRFVHYYENHTEAIQFYCRYMHKLREERGYLIEMVYLPHDAEVVELTREDGKSRKQIVEDLGFNVTLVRRLHDKMEGVQASRDILPNCLFDQAECDQGIKCLDSVRREWDEKYGRWKDEMRRDWSKHGYDAFEQFARGFVKNSGQRTSFEPSWG